MLAGCGDACTNISENGNAVVARCGETVQVRVGNEVVFIGDAVLKTEWISRDRLRISYPMDSHVHSRESRLRGVRVEYEAISR